MSALPTPGVIRYGIQYPVLLGGDIPLDWRQETDNIQS